MITVNLVVNVSEWFLVTYIHHCTFVSDCKFDDYYELPYWILFTPPLCLKLVKLKFVFKCYIVHHIF